MASILKVDDLRGNTSAGDITITSEGGAATMQLQQGLLKMWVMFNGSTVPTSQDSFNVASLTDNGAGDTTITRTNAMNNANYSASSMAEQNGAVFLLTGVYSTTQTKVSTKDSNSQSKNDYDRVGVHIAGDLA